MLRQQSDSGEVVPPRCGWMSPSGVYVCVKPVGHTGNHHTIRVSTDPAERKAQGF